MKIDIIGAGPAGNYTAYLLAKKGHSVSVYEKNPVVGPPVQCTGILSDYFLTIFEPKKDFVLNTVERTKIFSPNGKFVNAGIKKNYVVCRKKFDSYLAKMAESAGAEYHLSHSFNSFRKNGKKIISEISCRGKAIESEADVLIGADGPLSKVAKAAGLFEGREFVIGTQIEAKMKNNNIVEFYPYIGCYAWIVPVDPETVRIGVASYKNSMALFKKFAMKKIGKDYNKRTIENQSGVIPVFNPKVRAQKDNVYILGDAATFVKATSGGGINQSLKAAIILAECVDKELDYDKEWRKQMFLNLYVHLLAHRMHQRFTATDWNDLIGTFSSSKMKKILHDESRDRIVSMIIKIIAARPSLMKYAKYFPFRELKKLI
ncbi:TPA: NAD(P)/FAD-dependent oxidoreductase [Candidatus Woesearchaeota archaeon]|nr:Geranylgeranyl reductase [archaeon GW2011_AR15]MBS3103520.1 NAD(P)/FAD-dependent oxidoreductase [Candidatus Woesearchaeota archaeon]HIH41376.1 NAD(P)/FAD-dependent oxidoreductase [Candidatus Woesearchaeota archaeon]